jgi:hypothetical protein
MEQLSDFNSQNSDESLKRISVFEACMEHEPVTRSQAKRILSQCESFKEVILDFEKVQYISQGFSDEMFELTREPKGRSSLTAEFVTRR